MEKEFVKYEQALALKELGFDEPCFGSYVRGNEYKDWTNEVSVNMRMLIMITKMRYNYPDRWKDLASYMVRN